MPSPEGYTGLISEQHAKGIRRLECATARERWNRRLASVPAARAPLRRQPWLKFWRGRLTRICGELSVAQLAEEGRRPSVLQLFLEPLTASGGPQGFQLLAIAVQFDTRRPELTWTPIHVTAHAIERMQTRGNLRSVQAWVKELRPALLNLNKLWQDYDALDELSRIGPESRFHLATSTGYVRIVQETFELPMVTWLHALDLSDAQRVEAAMQAAEVKKALGHMA